MQNFIDVVGSPMIALAQIDTVAGQPPRHHVLAISIVGSRIANAAVAISGQLSRIRLV
jgi:hypothetical protein